MNLKLARLTVPSWNAGFMCGVHFLFGTHHPDQSWVPEIRAALEGGGQGGAAPTAYRGSQARGQLELHHSHSNCDQSTVCDLHRSSRQRQILNPLNEARDRTRIFTVTNPVC